MKNHKAKFAVVFNDVIGFIGIIKGEDYNNRNYKYITRDEYPNVLGITSNEILEYNSHSSNMDTLEWLKNKLPNYEFDDHFIV